MLGRALAQKLAEQMGQPVIADNRPGAGGNLGLELRAKAPPDGHTMVLSSPLVSISPSLYAKLNYDPEKDLAPVSLVAYIQNVIIVHPSVPARTLKELIAHRAPQSRQAQFRLGRRRHHQPSRAGAAASRWRRSNGARALQRHGPGADRDDRRRDRHAGDGRAGGRGSDPGGQGAPAGRALRQAPAGRCRRCRRRRKPAWRTTRCRSGTASSPAQARRADWSAGSTRRSARRWLQPT